MTEPVPPKPPGPISRALQNAVDNGCVSATGSDTDWAWTKPKLLEGRGPPFNGDTPLGTPSLCPLDYNVFEPGDAEPPAEMVDAFRNTGWFQELCMAMRGETGPQLAKVTTLGHAVVHGTIERNCIGCLKWLPGAGTELEEELHSKQDERCQQFLLQARVRRDHGPADATSPEAQTWRRGPHCVAPTEPASLLATDTNNPTETNNHPAVGVFNDTAVKKYTNVYTLLRSMDQRRTGK